MTKEEFVERLAKIFSPPIDTEYAHCEADDLMVEALKDLGYDTKVFEENDRWYA